MQDLLAVCGESARAVGHEPLALRDAYCLTEIRLTGLAELALATFRGIERNHMITGRNTGDARADLFDDTTTLVAEYGWECTFRVAARQGIRIRMTHARSDDPHERLTGFRPIYVDFLNRQRLTSFPCDGGFCFHSFSR